MPNKPTELDRIDERIDDLLLQRLLAAKAPMATCNRINDELEALRTTRARLVEANHAN